MAVRGLAAGLWQLLNLPLLEMIVQRCRALSAFSSPVQRLADVVGAAHSHPLARLEDLPA